jgi:hypothetical protein
MSFRAPRLRSKPKVTTAAPSFPGWANVKSAARQLYDPSVVVYPRVDLQTSQGAFVQVGKPSHEIPGASQARTILLSPTRLSPARKKEDKRTVQWRRWVELVETLIPEYLHLLRVTDHLKTRPEVPVASCGCRSGRTIEVICISFNGTSLLSDFSVTKLIMFTFRSRNDRCLQLLTRLVINQAGILSVSPTATFVSC